MNAQKQIAAVFPGDLDAFAKGYEIIAPARHVGFDAGHCRKLCRKLPADGQNKVKNNVNLDEPVLPDDILVIPKSFF